MGLSPYAERGDRSLRGSRGGRRPRLRSTGHHGGPAVRGAWNRPICRRPRSRPGSNAGTIVPDARSSSLHPLHRTSARSRHRRGSVIARILRPGHPAPAGRRCRVRIPITLLYVPADQPNTVAKALASAADVVIIDLEDAVAPERKELARDGLPRIVEAPATGRCRFESTPRTPPGRMLTSLSSRRC